MRLFGDLKRDLFKSLWDDTVDVDQSLMIDTKSLVNGPLKADSAYERKSGDVRHSP